MPTVIKTFNFSNRIHWVQYSFMNATINIHPPWANEGDFLSFLELLFRSAYCYVCNSIQIWLLLVYVHKTLEVQIQFNNHVTQIKKLPQYNQKAKLLLTDNIFHICALKYKQNLHYPTNFNSVCEWDCSLTVFFQVYPIYSYKEWANE